MTDPALRIAAEIFYFLQRSGRNKNYFVSSLRLRAAESLARREGRKN
jgi:hypothetical protein